MRQHVVCNGSAAIVVAASLAAAPVFAQAGPAAGAPSRADWFAAYQKESRLVPISGGRSLNLLCMGDGSPTVVLESGIGEGAFTWWSIQQRLAKGTRVCAYDRAGLGRSPPGPLPRDTRSETSDLETLLRAANVRAPYVLVGHSMGGYNARLFASRHMQDVAGMVLIDPSVEGQIPIIEAAVPAVAANDKRTVGYARYCADPGRTPEAAAQCARPAPTDLPPSMATEYVGWYGLPFFQTMFSEVESFLSFDSEQVSAERRPLGAMPFIVLTRGEKSTDMPADQAATEWKLWNGMHDELAKLSSAGSNRVVPGANHYIHNDKPDAVIDAIVEVVAAARRRVGKVK